MNRLIKLLVYCFEIKSIKSEEILYFFITLASLIFTSKGGIIAFTDKNWVEIRFWKHKRVLTQDKFPWVFLDFLVFLLYFITLIKVLLFAFLQWFALCWSFSRINPKCFYLDILIKFFKVNTFSKRLNSHCWEVKACNLSNFKNACDLLFFKINFFFLLISHLSYIVIVILLVINHDGYSGWQVYDQSSHNQNCQDTACEGFLWLSLSIECQTWLLA